jgi:hypothetical protein
MARRGTLSVAGFCLLLGPLAACQPSTQDHTVTTESPSGQSTAPASEAAEERDNALVRFIHGIPAGATVDLYADDARTFDGVAYKTVTPYREVEGQRYTFRLRPAGMAQAEPLASNSEGLDDGDYYTVVAVPGDGETAVLRVLEDDFSWPATGKARVRVVHAAADAGEVDLFADGRTELFDGIDFQSVSDYDEIDPWTGALQVRAQGEDAPLATAANVRFEAGKVYTVVVTGKLRGTPRLEAFVIEDQIGMPAR